MWAQAISDVTGRAQLLPELAIGASYGDALLAGIGAGMVPAETDWTRIAREITPNPRSRAMYDEQFATWAQLYPATRKPIHRLAAADPG